MTSDRNKLHNEFDLLKVTDIAKQETVSIVHNYFSNRLISNMVGINDVCQHESVSSKVKSSVVAACAAAAAALLLAPNF